MVHAISKGGYYSTLMYMKVGTSDFHSQKDAFDHKKQAIKNRKVCCLRFFEKSSFEMFQSYP